MSGTEKQTTDSGSVAQVLDEAEKERIQKRLDFGIQALSQQNDQILLNNEFIEHLPGLIQDLLNQEDQDPAIELLSQLERTGSHENPQIQERSITVLSLVFDKLVQEDNQKFVQIIVCILADWLRNQMEYNPSCETICSQLLEWSRSMFRRGRYEDIEYFLMTLGQIESGNVEASDTFVKTIRRVQKQFGADDVIDELLEISLNEDDPSSVTARNLLSHMGSHITKYLVDKLLLCESKEQRFQLIGMITSRGRSISGLLVKRLEDQAPWYFIRNIIMMMSMIDDDSLFPHIKTFLSCDDIRVQREAIHYIHRRGSQQKELYMLDALFQVDDELKIKLIMQLSSIGGEEIEEALLGLLAARKNLSKMFGKEVMAKACIGLEDSMNPKVIDLLTEIIEERKAVFGIDDRVVTAAISSLNKIEPRIRREEKQTERDYQQKEIHSDDEISYGSGYDLEALEERVDRLLLEDQHDIVEEMLYDQALLALAEKDFKTVNYLREKILQVNPGALSKAIELAGMIGHKEGKEIIFESDDKIWDELKGVLSKEKFDVFFNLLEHRQYQNDEIIVQQGNYDPCLYFIQSGFVNLTYRLNEYDRFLKRLRPGDVIGVQSLFDASVWSVSLVAQKNVGIYSLLYDRFGQLVSRYPEVENTLQNYCSNKDQVSELLQMSGEERRQAPRFALQAMIHNTLLDRFGIVGKREFKAEIVGISTGGLRFLTRISKRENRQSLLGRMIISEIENGESTTLTSKGTIIGVKEQKGMDKYHTIHVRFEKPLSQSQVTDVVSFNKPQPMMD